MATLEVEKSRYFSPAIIQTKPKWQITQGPLSISSAPFATLSASSAQLSFQIQVPSQNVFLDKRLPLTASVFIQLTVNPGAAAFGDPVLVLGRDAAVAPYPLHSLMSTIQITLGDTQLSTNMAQNRDLILRLLDSYKARAHKTSTSALDTFKSYNDAAGTLSNPLAGFGDALLSEPNGSSPDVYFVDPTSGADLVGAGNYTYQGTVYTYANGVPTCFAVGPAGGYPVFMRIASTELLQISPFQWTEDASESTGLFGLTNASLVINLQNPTVARMLRQCSTYGRTVTVQPTFFTPPTSTSPWQGARVDATFLTPSLSVPLAPRSILPWHEVVTYQYPVTLQPGGGQTAQSQTLSLPLIPDLVCFAVQPINQLATDAVYYLPVTAISLSWSNFSGLLSSLNTSQLYRICAENGLKQSYSQWRGRARTQRGIVQTVSGPLILAPGKDITLQEGEASGVVSNSTVQATLTIDNSFAAPGVPTACMLTVLCVNSGFLVSERGQSRIIRGPITQSDVLSAPIMGTSHDLVRMIGSGVHDKFANALSKSKDFMSGVAQTVKEQLPRAVASVASAARQMSSDLAHRIM